MRNVEKEIPLIIRVTAKLCTEVENRIKFIKVGLKSRRLPFDSDPKLLCDIRKQIHILHKVS